jgi:glutamyl-tRNA synthetase
MSQDQQPVRSSKLSQGAIKLMLRFALAPAEDMHIHHLRFATINWIVSRQKRAGFILRIEDVDSSRVLEGKDAEIKQFLEKFALPWDHIFYQKESLHRYQQLAVSLLEQDKAFVCTCSSEMIEADQAAAEAAGKPYRYQGRCLNHTAKELKQIQENHTPYVIRLKLPDDPISFDDVVQGTITTYPHGIDRFIILKADGTPERDFAAAVDDMLGGITTVIRKQACIAHTPWQIHIRQQLGYDQSITYAHLPAITETTPTPLTIKSLLEEGFLPDALLNYVIASGNKTPTDVFTLPEAVEWFDLDQSSHSPSAFDIDALRFLNREHLRRMDDKAASALYGFADASIGQLVKLYLEEASTLTELDAKIKPIFAPKPCAGTWEPSMRALAALIPTMPMFESFDELKTYMMAHTGLRDENLLAPLQLLLTGAQNSPSLDEIYPLIRSYITEVARCPH